METVTTQSFRQALLEEKCILKFLNTQTQLGSLNSSEWKERTKNLVPVCGRNAGGQVESQKHGHGRNTASGRMLQAKEPSQQGWIRKWLRVRVYAASQETEAWPWHWRTIRRWLNPKNKLEETKTLWNEPLNTKNEYFFLFLLIWVVGYINLWLLNTHAVFIYFIDVLLSCNHDTDFYYWFSFTYYIINTLLQC